ncbi:short-chain dehydrogenase/reductase [Sphingomonas sp. IBVSS2]|uniref:SDR family oxidoreductase n=1 Tax=Sphingomonas sp. IBVSS2 TaxID=1985172 RepID=UPI000A2DD8D0|nr:SDR family oxidoreductase [Sphingomonas sp. IBVSS2]OSZ63041.1 short-chain dehydrogenase/reductase [Sphingomonas sp. IBVSS2]
MTGTILITGTSSGLGRATARLFQAKGWNVIATMRDPASETELTQLANVLVTRLDVQDVASIAVAVNAGLARFGRIDALINNAGYGAFGPLEATPLENMRRQYDVNVLGLMATTKALLPHFRANRSGAIVNISSMGGRIAFPSGTLYHGTKFAVEGLSEALQYELAPLGIRVKIVEPGMIATDFTSRSVEYNNEPELAEYQPLIQSMGLLVSSLYEHASSPEVIAEVVYEATTDESDRLRYAAGADAEHLLAARYASSDAEFFAALKAQVGMV